MKNTSSNLAFTSQRCSLTNYCWPRNDSIVVLIMRCNCFVVCPLLAQNGEAPVSSQGRIRRELLGNEDCIIKWVAYLMFDDDGICK